MNVEQGWIEWNGGECPLPIGTVHQRRYRDGEQDIPSELGKWDAQRAVWQHNSSHPSCDIIAYRIVDPNKGDLEKGV